MEPRYESVQAALEGCVAPFHRDVGALDRPMTADEVETAITDYVNSVKARAQKK